jgi:hypothetical protein
VIDDDCKADNVLIVTAAMEQRSLKLRLITPLALLVLASAWPAAAWPPTSTLPKEQHRILLCSVSDTLQAKDCRSPYPQVGGDANTLIKAESDAPDYLAGAHPGESVLVMVRRSMAAPLDEANPGRAVAPASPGTPVTDPDWNLAPSRDDTSGYFPERALRLHMSGSALAQCTIGVHGDLLGCWVVVEHPPGTGFGEGVLTLSTLLQMKPLTKAGAQATGRPCIIRAGFDTEAARVILSVVAKP